mmetsp:Transcript_22890/g.66065  ORF Transcript_22890/g.66065 Transcript_22890/m.66065 type:complete len:638 (-) Transcript_22890:3384-5297(-)
MAAAAVRREASTSSATVVMVELVPESSDVRVMDIRPLLRLMDIATCAAAEKHTGVNCVTASMGDVVFEHIPMAGEMLELTATPVFAGRTSLDVGITVISVGDAGIRRFVCYASFTYVTTRGPEGHKRFCPPLTEEPSDPDDDSHGESELTKKWARTIAYYRRSLIKVEMKSASLTKNESGVGFGFETEFSEVVLPAHQNHMNHTFGGIVMGWMAKAALAEASRRSKRRVGTLLIRSVLRVEFTTGSDVSDHLIFRPRLNAIFDGGQSAEIEVRVSKRCIASGKECDMNVGCFYISGYHTKGEKVDKPFDATETFGWSALDKDIQKRITADAHWRRRLLLARRRLLGGIGEAVEWHPSLQDEAPLLTILAVLRLVHNEDKEDGWEEFYCLRKRKKTITSSIIARASTRSKDIGRTKTYVSGFNLEVTPGEPLGRKHTFILRGRAMVLNTTVPALFNIIKNKRTQWDELCGSIKVIEEKQEGKQENDREDTSTTVKWDVVEHEALTPEGALAMGYLFCWKTRSIPKKHVPLCLIRAWRIGKNDDTAVLASQSVCHPEAAKGSLTQVLPSGWFLSPVKDASGNNVGVSVTYVVEHDLVYLRRLAPVLKDRSIVETMASSTERWFYKLASITSKEASPEAT